MKEAICRACGGTFNLIRESAQGVASERLLTGRYDYFLHVDGSGVAPSERYVCDSCGKEFLNGYSVTVTPFFIRETRTRWDLFKELLGIVFLGKKPNAYSRS